MQLIFYYDPYNKGQNEGANFSPEYWFYVSYEKKQNKYVLCQNNERQSFDIFSDDRYDNIVSVSAIVGENGSGKTTLLRNILGDSHGGIIDDPMPMGSKNQYLCVVKDDNGNLYVRHKIEDGIFVNKTSIRSNHIKDGSVRNNKKGARRELAIDGVLKNTSLVYITNSYYEKWATGIYSSGGKIKDIKVSPAAVGNISDQFFKILVFHNNDPIHTVDSDYLWKQRLQRFNTYYGIQPILDLKYLKRLKDEASAEKILYNNTPEGFKVTFNSIDGILVDGDSEFLNYKKEKDPWRDNLEISYENSKDIYDERVLWNGKTIEELRKKLPEEDRICRYIYLNLLFELYIEIDEKIPDDLNSIDDVISCVKSMLGSEKYVKMVNIDYYKNALKEIEAMVLISAECDKVKNIYPPSDLAYDRRMVFIWGTKACDEFLDFVDRQFCNHFSFTLKYLSFQQERMSSGQRCLQNYMTWLDVLPNMEIVMGNKIQVLHDHILLIIDEIDLYLHPEWQRRIINELCKELFRLFPKKKIQLIISTHSPLCLSDIPAGNTVYLYADRDGYHIKNRRDTDETFGREIYMLYHNAFFLQNTMGEYATNYINEVLEEAGNALSGLFSNSEKKTQLNDEERKMLYNKIGVIGNEIIRMRLQKMMDLIDGESVE